MKTYVMGWDGMEWNGMWYVRLYHVCMTCCVCVCEWLDHCGDVSWKLFGYIWLVGCLDGAQIG